MKSPFERPQPGDGVMMQADLLGGADPENEEKIAELRREIALRRGVYARAVKEGTMTQAVADRQLGLMQAILTDVRILPAARKVAEAARRWIAIRATPRADRGAFAELGAAIAVYDRECKRGQPR